MCRDVAWLLQRICQKDAETLIRHLDKELDRIARVVKRLHQWGYAEVNVVTDHGFVLVAADQLPPEVPVKKEWCVAFKERFAMVPAALDVPLKTKPFPWDASVRVAIPRLLPALGREGNAHGALRM